MDVGFRADLLGHIERLLKGLVQPSARSLLIKRELISRLELAEDFRLTQHHRIQAAGHIEEMSHGRFAGVLVKDLIRIRVHLAVLQQKRAQFVEQYLGLILRSCIDFHAITSGQNHSLLRHRAFAQGPVQDRQFPFRQSKPFAHGDWRGTMVQA